MSLSEIEIQKIDIADLTYRVSGQAVSELEWSPSDTLFHPVWLQQRPEKTYRIVDGFRVVAKAREAALSTLPAFVFSEDYNRDSLWIERLRKKMYERELPTVSVLETLFHFTSLRHVSTIPDRIADFFEEKKITPIPITLDWLRDFVGKLPVIKGFCDSSQLGFSEARRLAKKEIGELTLLNSLLSGLNLKGNKLTSMLGLIDELNRGYQLTLKTLLANETIREALERKSGNQLYKSLKTTLNTLRYPELSSMRARWNKSVTSLKLPPNISIQNDPYFEEEFFTIEINVTSLSALQKSITCLRETSESELFDTLFSLL